MDFYKSMNDLKNYFLEFVRKTSSFGKSFICIDDKINNELIKNIKKKIFILMVKEINQTLELKTLNNIKLIQNLVWK